MFTYISRNNLWFLFCSLHLLGFSSGGDNRDDMVEPRLTLEFLNGHKYSFPTELWNERDIMEKVMLRSLELEHHAGLDNAVVPSKDDWRVAIKDDEFVEAEADDLAEEYDQPVRDWNKKPGKWSGGAKPDW